jgi:phospholipase A1
MTLNPQHAYLFTLRTPFRFNGEFERKAPGFRVRPLKRAFLGFALVLLLRAGAALRAEGLVETLAGPSSQVASGARISVTLLAANTGSANAYFDPAEKMRGFVHQGGMSWPVTFERLGGNSDSVAPGSFSSCQYGLQLPPGVVGRLVLEVDMGGPVPLEALILAGESSTEAFAQPSLAQPKSDHPPMTVSAASTVQRSFQDHFTTHLPVYFIYGAKAPAAKFQFSFKYRLLSFDDFTSADPAESLQFAYSQRSLWDTNADSSPFYDTSYMPALFYQYEGPAPARDGPHGGMTWLGFQSGYQHESNGQAGSLSRSMNTLYIRTAAVFGNTRGWHAIVVARVFDYIGGLSDNPDLKDYRGYGDWQVIVGKGDGTTLSYMGWSGKHLNHFTSQYDLNIPVRIKLLDYSTYFLIQYFDGYGESLRSYNRYSDTLRAGISLVR